MKETMIQRFGKREGFCVVGFSLKQIAIGAAEIYGNNYIKINVPYNGFNCRGTANKVAKEVSGLTPFAKERLDRNGMTTMYYGDKQICGRGYYLPFLSDCEVFFVKSVRSGEIIEISLVRAPSWREYL